MVKVKVIGNDNEIEIEADGKIYQGEIYDIGNDENNDYRETWEIEGTLVPNVYPVIDDEGLEELATIFLNMCGIEDISFTEVEFN